MIHTLDMYYGKPRGRKVRRNAFSTGVFPLPLLRGRKWPVPGRLMAQMRKGTTAWIVLAVLEKRGELYGYGLRREVFMKSKGLFSIQEGPLYRLLSRMQRARWISSRLQTVSGRGRRYYRVSARGRHVLAEYRREWKLLLSVLETLGCHHV
jgi:PadR family transcriptional regulator, regulatory protein PadR